MSYLFDVLVNWIYGGDSMNYIPEIYEWRDDDNIQTLERVPVIKVSKEIYNYLERDYGIIPDRLLEYVHQETVVTVRKKEVRVDGVMVVTDGVSVLAISSEGTKETFFKSRIPLTQELSVLEQATQMQTFDCEFEIPKREEEKDNSLLGYLSDVTPEYMRGLTRQERELKAILFDIFFDLACSTNTQQVRYWYVEMFPYEYEQSKSMTKNKMLKKMFDEIRFGWGTTHFNFGNKLVKFSGVFGDLWADILGRPDVKKLPARKEKNKKKG